MARRQSRTNRRILCPVDLSGGSRRALAYAARIAEHYNAELIALEVSWAGLPPIAYPGASTSNTPPLLTPKGRAALLGELRSFAGRVTGRGVRTRMALREGAVVPAVLAEAKERSVDLIVIGSHGHGRIERWLLGSVAEKVLRKASCPVIVVPSARTSGRTGRTCRAILCPIDFSPASLAALKRAHAIAEEWSTTLVAVHIVDWSGDGPRPAVLANEIEEYGKQLYAEGTRRLHEAIVATLGNSPRVQEVTATGRPHDEIARLAKKHRADLIVIGAHSRRPFLDAFLGSTTNQVVRHGICPVMVVRP